MGASYREAAVTSVEAFVDAEKRSVQDYLELFATQSFRVMRDGTQVGSLVMGRGGLQAAADADPVESYFVSLVPERRPTSCSRSAQEIGKPRVA